MTFIPKVLWPYRQAATYIASSARALANLNPSVKSVMESGISALKGSDSEILLGENFEPSVVGLNNARMSEPVCNFEKAGSERVISNLNNAWIVLGRDRNSGLASGYGGSAHAQCAAIDLVVGRGGPSPSDGIYASTDFKTDAARIYISQKADIDEYLKLADGSVGISEARSAIGMKADSIRIVSRKGIKLVTGVDESNSIGGFLLTTKGIDLIAGNNDKDLQPIPKGDNLVDSIRELKGNLNDLNAIVIKFLMNQMIFNMGVQAHTHAPSFGMGPSIELQPIGFATAPQIISALTSSWLNKVNLLTYDFNFLYPFSKKWICGANRTN